MVTLLMDSPGRVSRGRWGKGYFPNLPLYISTDGMLPDNAGLITDIANMTLPTTGTPIFQLSGT